MDKVLIAMSGGVDSSVAAYLMKKQGFECIGITMKLFNNEDVGVCRENTCCSLSDIADARSVALKLDIPYYVFNFTSDFKGEVIDRFVSAYQTGATPNPCIDCNRYIKFKKLMHRANEIDCNFVVTGHYARIEKSKDRFLLKKAVDETKDQSYVLYSMSQQQLSQTLFPLGNLRKTEVRKIAMENGFINAKKHDSQDICFVTDGDYIKFIEEHTGSKNKAGDFTDSKGNILGKHKGIISYTVGQRKGLGITFGKPMYVCKTCPESNTVVLGGEAELYSKSFYAENINLIACDKIPSPLSIKAKIRYKQTEQPATVVQTDENTLHIKFEKAQRAITKGQAVVLYDGDYVIGGGTII